MNLHRRETFKSLIKSCNVRCK